MNIYLNSKHLGDALFLVDWKVNEVKGQLEIKAENFTNITMQYAFAETSVLKRLMDNYPSEQYYVTSEMANDIEELLFDEGISINHIYFDAKQVILNSEPSNHIALTSIGPLVLSNQAVRVIQELKGFTSSKQVINFLSKENISSNSLKRDKSVGNQYIAAGDYKYVVSYDGNIKGYKTFFLITVVKNERKGRALFTINVENQKIRFDKSNMIGLLNIIEAKASDKLPHYSATSLANNISSLQPEIKDNVLILHEVNVNIKLLSAGDNTFTVDSSNDLSTFSSLVPEWFTLFEICGHKVRLTKTFAKKTMQEQGLSSLVSALEYIKSLSFDSFQESPVRTGVFYADTIDGCRFVINEDLQIISKVEKSNWNAVRNSNVSFVIKESEIHLLSQHLNCNEDEVLSILEKERVSFNPDQQDQERLDKGQFIVTYPGLRLNLILRWAKNGMVYALSCYKNEQVPPYVLVDGKKYIFSNAAKKMVLQSHLVNKNERINPKQAIEQLRELEFIDVSKTSNLESSNFDFCLESRVNNVKLFGFVNNEPRNLTIAFIEKK